MKDIYQQQIVPAKPRVLDEERIYVYMPSATHGSKGLASFNQRDFSSPDGHVSLRWPTEMLIEQLANPVVRPSYIKITDDEFENTGTPTALVHPTTGIRYVSNTAEVKLKRKNRTALVRPDLVMLDNTDFTEIKTGDFNKYQITRHDPFTTRTIIRIDGDDFNQKNDITQINWPKAFDRSGSAKTDGYGLIRIDTDGIGALKYNTDGNLQVDTTKLQDIMKDHLALRPTYSPEFANKDNFVDQFGLAKRDARGNTLISITKDAVGLSNVENRTFASREYHEFGTEMKDTFDTRFNTKLDQDKWDGPTGLFRDWAPISNDRNTVQKWFMRLEQEDDSLWSSIRTLRLFLGFFETPEEVTLAYPPEASLYGCHAFITDTLSYWSVRPKDMDRYQFVYRDHTGLESISGMQVGDRAVNINNNHEHIWNGSIWVYDGIHNDEWTWYNTLMSSPTFFDYVESDAGALQPNAPVANVSVGTSGKWIQSDHVHPSDPTKLDASALESATITITTNEPSEDDFFLKVTSVIILDHNDEQIDAVIVPTPQYLGQVPNPKNGDLAIARNLGKIYRYNGTSWIDTNTLGTILYDANNSVNIPYIRTSQYLHNWKSSPSEFNQGQYTNEIYWKGTENEFNNLDMSDLDQNALFIVEDEEHIIPGYFATEEQISDAGLTLSNLFESSEERFVTTKDTLNLSGQPITLKQQVVAGKTRHVVEQLNFGTVTTAPNDEHAMAIILDGHIRQRRFVADRMIRSNPNGNLEVDTIHVDNYLITAESPTATELELGRLLVSAGPRTITTFNATDTSNLPIVSSGDKGVKVAALSSKKVVITDTNGGLSTVDWDDTNLLFSTDDLSHNRLLVGNGSKDVSIWQSGGVSGSVIVRGSNDGEITTLTHTNENRILLSGPDGTLVELNEGAPGQFLAAGAEGTTPGWVNGPVVQGHTPQTVLTSNPTDAEANAFKGLVAVVLDKSIPTNQLRNNCIYYW